MKHAERIAEEQLGFSEVLLKVDIKNDAALALYR